MSQVPRVEQDDPYYALWGRAEVPDGSVVLDILEPPRKPRHASPTPLRWTTRSGAAVRKRARAASIAVGLFAGLLASLSLLLISGRGDLAIASLAPIAGASGWAVLHAQRPELRGDVGRSTLPSLERLHERHLIQSLLAAAVDNAGLRVVHKGELTERGTLQEWRLDVPVRVSFELAIYGASYFDVTVTTQGVNHADIHQRLKGWIQTFLADAIKEPGRTEVPAHN